MLRRGGYTLLELIIVVLLVGLLAAYAVPKYLRSVEITKADDAVALVSMVGTTNKMFALNHANQYVFSATPIAGGAGICPPGACPSAGPYDDACILVWCKYLANQDFSLEAYDVYACNGNVSGPCAGLGSGTFVSGARRKAGAASPYDTWGFTMDIKGALTSYGTTQLPPSY